MSVEDMDPINALTMVTVAREKYLAAVANRDKANADATQALRQLDEAQKQFDAVATFLKSNAPPESWWGP